MRLFFCFHLQTPNLGKNWKTQWQNLLRGYQIQTVHIKIERSQLNLRSGTLSHPIPIYFSLWVGLCLCPSTLTLSHGGQNPPPLSTLFLLPLQALTIPPLFSSNLFFQQVQVFLLLHWKSPRVPGISPLAHQKPPYHQPKPPTPRPSKPHPRSPHGSWLFGAAWHPGQRHYSLLTPPILRQSEISYFRPSDPCACQDQWPRVEWVHTWKVGLYVLLLWGLRRGIRATYQGWS